MSVARARSALYSLARFLGDVNAVKRGVVVAIGIALVVVAALPAGAASAKRDDARTILTKVGAAFEAHGITPCETPDWTAKLDVFDEPIDRDQRAKRIRLVMGPDRPCPARDAYADEVEWENAHDGTITVIVYKNAKARARWEKRRSSLMTFVYGKRTLIDNALPSPELDGAFFATMKDLKARRAAR